MTVTRTNHTKLGTIVFDSSAGRALVYKVGVLWIGRVGKPHNYCVTGMYSGGVSCEFKTRKAAELWAVQMLGGE